MSVRAGEQAALHRGGIMKKEILIRWPVGPLLATKIFLDLPPDSWYKGV